MQKIEFTRIAKFKFNNEYYQMFKARRNKIAFLKINEKGQYEFPTVREFSSLVRFFMEDSFDTLAFFDDSKHRKYKFMPYIKEKINGCTRTVMITSMLVLATLTGCKYNDTPVVYAYDEYYNNSSYQITSEKNIEDNNDENITKESETTKSATQVADNFDSKYRDPHCFYETDDFELLESSKMITLYNNKYFKDIFKVDNYTVDDVKEVTNNNKNIPKEYLDFINEFTETMNNYYPNLDNRLYYHNISTLKFDIKVQDDVDFIMSGSVAFYDIPNNTMVLANDIDLNDPKSRLIFRHELGHLFNHLRINYDGYDIKYYFNDAGRGKYLKEAMDVIFTTDPYTGDYPDDLEKNMGYPITTNIVRILVDCMGYNIEDSVSHNVYEFERQLNEINPNGIEASVIEEIIEFQWKEYNSADFEVDREEYKDLYEYVAKLYIDSYITPDMSYSEINQNLHELEERLVMGVEDPSYVLLDVVSDTFEDYISKNHISKSTLTH